MGWVPVPLQLRHRHRYLTDSFIIIIRHSIGNRDSASAALNFTVVLLGWHWQMAMQCGIGDWDFGHFGFV
jgi:hypothetical protein